MNGQRTFIIGCAVLLLFVVSPLLLSAQTLEEFLKLNPDFDASSISEAYLQSSEAESYQRVASPVSMPSSGTAWGSGIGNRTELENRIVESVMEDIEMTSFNVKLDTKPVFPEPLQETTIILNDYSMGTVGAQIKWFIDDAHVPDSDNKRSLTLQAPSLGKSVKVDARIHFTSGRDTQATVTLAPVQIDVVVEPETRVPVFYRGRSLATQQSTIKLAAFVYGNEAGVPMRGLSYRWETNNTVIDGGSQYEGNVIRFTPPLRREVSVKLSVLDASGTTIGTKLVHIPLVQPQVSFYETNPLRGQSLLAVQNPLLFSGPEMTLRAEPYYLSPEAYLDQRREVQWLLNGRESLNGEDPYILTLQKQGGGGNAIVNFRFRNFARQTQVGEGAFRVQF